MLFYNINSRFFSYLGRRMCQCLKNALIAVLIWRMMLYSAPNAEPGWKLPSRILQSSPSRRIRIPLRTTSRTPSHRINIPLRTASRMPRRRISILLRTASRMPSRRISTPLRTASRMPSRRINIPHRTASRMPSRRISIPLRIISSTLNLSRIIIASLPRITLKMQL